MCLFGFSAENFPAKYKRRSILCLKEYRSLVGVVYCVCVFLLPFFLLSINPPWMPLNYQFINSLICCLKRLSRVTRINGLHMTLPYVFRCLFQGCILVLPKSLGRSSSSVGGAVTYYLVATGTEPLVAVLAWACSRVAGVVGAYPALYLRLIASSVYRRRSCSLSL